MKIVRLEVDLKIPETDEECKSLWGDKGDCFECAYRLDDPLPPCMHQKILESVETEH